jgi:subtilase family serine protease
MRSLSLRLIGVLAIAGIAVAACGGGGATSTGAALQGGLPGPVFNDAAVPPQLRIPHWGEAIVREATYLGPVRGALVSANVLVHQQNAQGLIAYAQAANDPSSPVFRQWLTPQEIGERYGASLSDYQTVAQYFAQQGLAVAAWPQRMILTVSGPQAAMERAFSTQFGLYRLNGQTFVAPVTTPHFSQPLPVDEVGGLVAYHPMHRYLIVPPRVGAGAQVGYSPEQIRAAFGFNEAYAAGYTGQGATVAIIGTGPIDTAYGSPGASCNTNGGTSIVSGDVDLNALQKLYNVQNVANVYEQCVTASGVSAGLSASGIPTAPPASPVPNQTPPPCQNCFPYSSQFATPPPVTAPTCKGGLPSCNPEDGEAQLDVQQAAMLAPGSNVDFYLAYNSADCSTWYPNPCATSGSNAGAPAIGIVEADPEIQQVIADDTADVISMSYGGGEPQQFPNGLSSYSTSYYHLEFAALAAEGIAAFASSGDSGSAECLGSAGGYLPQVCVSYPSGDPFVTSVGGVSVAIDALGRLELPILAWGISTSDSGYGATGASGGGTSTFMSAPSWQINAIASPSPTSQYREQPDVSMIGDPATGVTFVTNAAFSGGPGVVGGTSVASPEMAALWGIVLGACKAHPGQGMCPANNGNPHFYRLGVAAPYLYAIYACKAAPCSAFNWTNPGAKSTQSVTPALPYGQVFYDVLYGSNEMAAGSGPATPVPGYAAMVGYDEVTGIGVPFAARLVQAVTGQAIP